MKLRATLLRAEGAEDVVVTADADATIGDVAAALAGRAATPDAPSVTLEAVSAVRSGDTIVLDPRSTLAHATLADGIGLRLVHVGARSEDHVGTIEVVRGPDAGRRIPLTTGSFTIGRDDACDIVLGDPLVSKRHARLEVGSDRVELVDLNSANGVLVGDAPVARLEAQGGRLEATLGNSTIVVTTRTPVVRTAGAVQRVQLVRSPRVEERYAGEELPGTDLPRPAKRSPFPWLALAAPLIMGGVLFLIMHNPTTLLFLALAPFIMIGTWLTSFLQGRREAAQERETFAAQLARLETRLTAEREREIDIRRREVPSLAAVSGDVIGAGPLVWTRRPEHWSHLHVQLGTGDTSSRSSVAESRNRDAAVPMFVDRLDEVVERFRMVPAVPILEALPAAGALGVCGPREHVSGYVRGLVAQLTGLHAPGDLVVTALLDAAWSRELADLKWLPHAWEAESIFGVSPIADNPATAGRLVAQLEELVASRSSDAQGMALLGALGEDAAATRKGAKVGVDDRAAGPSEAPRPAVVVLIGGEPPADLARLIQLTEDAAERGILPVWIRHEAAALPAGCRTFVEFEASGDARACFVRLGSTVEHLVTEPLSAEHLGVFSRALARLADAGRVERDTSDVPRTVPLLQLVGREMAEQPEAVVDRWEQNESIPSRLGARRGTRTPSKLRALVGQSAEGAMHLDLRTQGPHALVGGTTGSGKSEFLQAWVLGMAAEYSPQRVTFLFVDYKGGSAFADCIRLPHCVGLVTDLNPHLVRRVLTSLRAELHHRERLFNRKKAKDILELEKRGDPDAPPALVLVIDEFAALATEVPEFVDGVVDIAQRGRSLGIHLIMATQRPAGVIKDNLRANTNLRVALRMADENDSTDVVGAKDAALFDPGLPGRGIAKTGPGRMTLFQSAYTGGWSLAGDDSATVEIASFHTAGLVPWDRAGVVVSNAEPADPGPNDQQLLVARMREASALAHLPEPRRPWLDELATRFDQTKLPQRSDDQLVLGVVDVPERQDQVAFAFHPDAEGHIAFFGTGGSGKSVALRTLAISAGITPRGGPVVVYGIDFSSGGLRMLEPLPHVGSIIQGDDTERVTRLFGMLRDELDRRGDAYASVNAGSITEYRAFSGVVSEPRILVLIDGFGAMRNEYEGVTGRAESYRILQQVLSDGRALGIHVALTADRAQAVPNALHALIQRRIVLRMADADAYAVLDVPRDILGANAAPGRAVVDRHEAQIAVIGGTRSTKEQSLAIERMAASMRRRGRSDANEIGALPTLYSAEELPPTVGGDAVAIGLGDSDLGPVGIESTGVLLVAGPVASGRTNALAAVVAQARRARPDADAFYLGKPRSAAAALAWTGAASDSSSGMSLLSAITERMDAGARPVVAIEGIGEYATSVLEMSLSEIVRRAGRGDALLVVEGELAEWASSFGLLGEIKAARRGILLQPETIDGEIVLKTPLPRMLRSEFPVGRGVLVQRGRATRVQLPLVLAEQPVRHG